MSPTYQIYIVLLIEVFDNDLSECVGYSPVIFSPVYHILFWVCWVTPQEVAQEPWVWHISWAEDLVDLLKVVQLWWESTVNAENLIVYYSCYRETVEALDKLFPQLQRIPSFALVIKSVNSVNGPALVISSQKEEIFGILNLIGEQEADHLKVLLPSVHVVS